MSCRIFIIIYLCVLYENNILGQSSSSNVPSDGSYKMMVKKTDIDSIALVKYCILFAQTEAIEKAFGKVISQKSNFDLENINQNDKVFTNEVFSISSESNLTGRWVKDIDPPLVEYLKQGKEKWISVKVNGFVREIKPKSFNEDREAMGLYIKDLYLKYPFSDITIVENYENKYLISVVELIKANYKSNSDMSRVAQTKARAQVSRYINGIKTEDIFIIKTTDLLKDNKESVADTYSAIKESSFGWVNSMDLLAVFQDETGLKSVFIYSKKIENEKK